MEVRRTLKIPLWLAEKPTFLLMSYLDWIRSQVGQRKIFLAFTSVVLRDEQGRLLLQRRTDFDVWGLPGGMLEPGEDILTCARRELLEESGLTAGDLSLVGVYTGPEYAATYPNGDQVQQYTICLQGPVMGGQMQVDGIETSEQRFFEPGEIPFEQLPLWYEAMIQDALSAGEPAFEPPHIPTDPIPQIKEIRQIIGTALYIGVGAVAVTRRDDGRILMVQLIDNGQWSFPGGYMHLGENAAFTAVRETHEETGLQVMPERLLGVYTTSSPWVYPHGDQVQPVITVFLSRFEGGTPKADGEETCAVTWMTREEIAALEDIHPLIRPLHTAILKHLDGGNFIEYG